QDKRYFAAEKVYNTLLAQDPNNMKILNNYLALLIEREHPEVVSKLKQLEELNPKQAFIPSQIGIVLYRNKNFEDASKYFAKAVRLEPNNSGYIYHTAMAYELAKRQVLAINYYKMLSKFTLPTEYVPLTKAQLNKKIKLLQG
ncbi:MAG: tetratricopeptide repeat protein, partial [Pseudomonadota bacterium]